jgi:hypothetical protein
MILLQRRRKACIWERSSFACQQALRWAIYMVSTGEVVGSCVLVCVGKGCGPVLIPIPPPPLSSCSPGSLIAAALGWRAAFLIEALVALPTAAFALLMPPADIKRGVESAGTGVGTGGDTPSSPPSSSPTASFWRDVERLSAYPATLLTILAVSINNGSLGGLTFYGPKAARDLLRLDPKTADLTFGGITVVTGALGTLSGGLLLAHLGSSVQTALKLCMAGVGIASLAIAVSVGNGRFRSVVLQRAPQEKKSALLMSCYTHMHVFELSREKFFSPPATTKRHRWCHAK